jgi:methyl-accepting chemotaxis protein
MSTMMNQSISTQFFERYGDVKAFAANPSVQSMESAAIEKALNTYAKLYEIYDLIVVVNTEGKWIASNTKSPNGKDLDRVPLENHNFGASSWFQALKAGKFTEDETKGFTDVYVEDPQFNELVSKLYGHQAYDNVFASPIRNEQGKTVGYIANYAGFRWAERELQFIYGALEQGGFQNSELTLLNRNGTVISELDPSLHQGSREIFRDFTVLNQLNLAEKGVFAALELVKGKSGIGTSFHDRKKIEQFSAYSSLDGPKFVTSLGWGVMLRAEKSVSLAAFARIQNYALVSLLILVALSSYFGLRLAIRISKSLESIGHRAKKSTKATLTISKMLRQASEKSSAGVSEQAASIQETCATLHEISAMISRSADHAKSSSESTELSFQISTEGKTAVQAMRENMVDISHAIHHTLEEIGESNRQMTSTIKIIENISQKTKLIDEIVFQTKLLSFNASVEAARAGEHGKGFSVVAEEVGNLANMSGRAAREISELLATSREEVVKIIRLSHEVAESMKKRCLEKIDSGVDKANRCDEIIAEIVGHSGSVKSLMHEISVATKEQETGISNITTAMNQLDVTTQMNADMAHEAMALANNLSAQSRSMSEDVKSLTEIVFGTKTAAVKPTTPETLVLSTTEAAVADELEEQDRVA